MKSTLRQVCQECGHLQPIFINRDINIQTPIINLVTGLEVKTIGDLLVVTDLIEHRLTQILKHVTPSMSIEECERLLMYCGALIITLLEALYAGLMTCKGCIPEGEVCTTHPILTDSLIRNLGVDIVSGTIPGIIIVLSLDSKVNVNLMASTLRELAKRNFLIFVVGLPARRLEDHLVDGERTLFEEFPENVLKFLPLLSAVHLVGVLVRIANIFAGKNITGSFLEIANYILNRVSIVVQIWGDLPIDQVPLVAGLNYLGVPVLIISQSRPCRLLTGRVEMSWKCRDLKSGKIVEVEKCPHSLTAWTVPNMNKIVCETLRLIFRPCDTTRCRLAKLSHYVDLSLKVHGRLPEDLIELVRVESEIPISRRDEILSFLKERGWTEREVYTDLSLV